MKHYGDMFRYPCSYSCEYKFNDKDVDVKNFYIYLLSIFHFIDSCDSWLDNIKELEMEMRREWQSDMSEYIDWEY